MINPKVEKFLSCSKSKYLSNDGLGSKPVINYGFTALELDVDIDHLTTVELVIKEFLIEDDSLEFILRMKRYPDKAVEKSNFFDGEKITVVEIIEWIKYQLKENIED